MGLHWQDWLEDFEDFIKGSKVTDSVQQLTALGNLIGKDIGQVIKELQTDTASSYQWIRKALNRKFLHKWNIDYERCRINLASQERDESGGRGGRESISRLKRLPRYCASDAFTTEDTLRPWIIEGCQS
ncbi:hypothetical protein NDU88_001809 [Pleurodeles waltl]|uniref:Uncharacterized protein n=1 Tax=Pleurodeles waltl TaxID=8319 RepID=A0AAV7KQG5_PLEWA|nr:hypothetical protein NDU88_001809 [Pleurodeles waltl]